MTTYHTSRRIAATPDAIWEVLTDGGGYPSWNPSVARVEGRIALGERIKVFTKATPGRAFPVRVKEFVAGERMTWVGGMPLGLFKGQRTFTLAPQGDGATEFTMREVFSGPLGGLVGRSMPDLTEPFEQFASGLKDRAEHG